MLFLGDSLVAGWRTTGAQVWEERYAHRGAVALGFAGESARGVLRRVARGEFDGFAPRLVVLLAGTNDLGGGASADAASRSVTACVAAVRSRFPDARILLLGLLPRGDGRRGGRVQRDVRAVNAALAALDDGAAVRFADLADAFTTPRGAVRPELFEPDKLHLSAAGYRVWADAMAPVFNALA